MREHRGGPSEDLEGRLRQEDQNLREQSRADSPNPEELRNIRNRLIELQKKVADALDQPALSGGEGSKKDKGKDLEGGRGKKEEEKG